MARRDSTCCRPSARVTIALLALVPALASAQTWSGSGPFSPNANSRTVRAFVVDSATGTVYAGTGSGTVFSLSDASLSQPPVATNDHVVVAPETAAEIAVLANDADPEGALDASSIDIQTPPTNGAATANGTATYTPDAGFIGTDSFTYTVRDRAGNESNTATVSVRVNALPVAGNDTASTQEGVFVMIDVLENDSDADGTIDPASVVIWNSPANGDTDIEPDGRITYIPVGNFSGTDSFTYRVRDNDGGLSNEATVTVTVTAAALPSVPPVAHDDSAGTLQGVAVTVAVLDNDIDSDGTLDAATVAIQSGPANGSATINANGSVTYIPNADFSGTDTFTYIVVADDDGTPSNTATVTVSVNASVEPPPPPSTTPRRRGGGGSTGVLLLAALVGIRLLKQRASVPRA